MDRARVRVWEREGHTVSTDPERLDRELIARFLAEESYWATGRPAEVIDRSIEGSLCFGLYARAGQLGFARVVTDWATFAWVCDVFVVPEARGRGLGVWLMECVVAHPELQGIRRWMLATRDAHELYRKVGFSELPEPSRFMIRQEPPPIG